MWKIYACSDANIAIVTDIEMLKDSIKTDKNIKGAIVKHEDKKLFSPQNIESVKYFNNYKKLQETVRKAALYKRKHSEYEKEFRLIYQHSNLYDQDKNYITVDINKLIKYIYISPMVENYIKNIIIQTLKKLQKSKKI